MADARLNAPLEATVAIFARAPVRGRVKTRLARQVGEAVALEAHSELFARTLRRLRGVGTVAALEVWFDEIPRQSIAIDVPVVQQAAGDLGLKMASAIETITRSGRVAVIVGSDCPLLDAAYVRSALASLASCDVVVGPAEDGGYVLIAMRRPVPSLFVNVRWGTDTVLADTMAQARNERVSLRCLNALWDVDELDDWRRYERLRARELSGDA